MNNIKNIYWIRFSYDVNKYVDFGGSYPPRASVSLIAFSSISIILRIHSASSSDIVNSLYCVHGRSGDIWPWGYFETEPFQFVVWGGIKLSFL